MMQLNLFYLLEDGTVSPAWCLEVTDPLVRGLYDGLLLSGGRYVATVLYSQELAQIGF